MLGITRGRWNVIQIDISGVDNVIRRLGQMRGTAALRPPMQTSVQMLKSDMQLYPSAPQGSTYRRTGTLGRRWVAEVNTVPGGVHGVVGNNTVYAPYVQSSKLQAGVHRSRWQTETQVLQRRTQAINTLFENAIRRALGG